MKINAFNVTTTHELMASRLRNQSMEEAAKATTQHASVQKTETQKQPKTSQKKSESASTASAKDGVYIQDINGKLWKTEDWDGSVKPNAIAVITPKHKFRIALKDAPSRLRIRSRSNGIWNAKVTCAFATFDFDGARNTKDIMERIYKPSTDYAAAWCNEYTFPDGVTKGYLPALGELCLAYQNIAAIREALWECGGEAPFNDYYWSSTFLGLDGKDSYYWASCWETGNNCISKLSESLYVRAFAPFEI